MKDIGIAFRIMCHNQHNFFSPKMVMYKNGNVSRNIKNNEDKFKEIKTNKEIVAILATIQKIGAIVAKIQKKL